MGRNGRLRGEKMDGMEGLGKKMGRNGRLNGEKLYFGLKDFS